MQMIRRLLDSIYPPVCEHCGDSFFSSTTSYLCDPCKAEVLLPIKLPYCEVCGQSYTGKMPQAVQCSNCRGRDIQFDFAIAAYHAEGEVMDWMHRFKYGKEIHLCRMFGDMMIDVWQDRRLDREDDWIVVPVPLHKKRLRERGFNQSCEIARHWINRAPSGKNLKLMNLLTRQRHTDRQAMLDRKERLTNLKDAFKIDRIIPPDQNLLLVDDVLTTGTTTAECADVLVSSLHPRKICVVSVLRG